MWKKFLFKQRCVGYFKDEIMSWFLAKIKILQALCKVQVCGIGHLLSSRPIGHCLLQCIIVCFAVPQHPTYARHLKISKPCTRQTNALLMSQRNADALSLRKLPFPAFNAVFSKSCTRRCSSVWGWPTIPLNCSMLLISSSFRFISKWNHQNLRCMQFIVCKSVERSFLVPLLVYLPPQCDKAAPKRSSSFTPRAITLPSSHRRNIGLIQNSGLDKTLDI